MKKTIVIKKKYEFKRLFSKGKIYYGKNITMYVMQNQKEYNKFGIAIGKKSGTAVNRNKIKRLIRENYRLFEDNLKVGYNLIFSVNRKAEIKNIGFYDIKDEMQKLLKKSEIWINEE